MSAPKGDHAFGWKCLVGVFFLPAALLAAVPAAFAQGSDATSVGQPPLYSISSRYATNDRANTFAQPAGPAYSAPSVWTAPSWRGMNWKPPADSVFGGVEYLLVRTHFSEAIAYVQATDTLANGVPTASVQAREINFPYSSAFRTYLGYNFTPSSALQFTYFHLGDSASISATPGAPNQYFVDAYTGRTNFGDSTTSNSSVRLNVFDLDWMGRYSVGDGRLSLRPAAGARWADVRQHNDTSVFAPGGSIIDTGTFNSHFTGFGPHFSLFGQYRLRPNSPFSLIARGAGSLLVGGFNNTEGATFTGVASATQSAHRTLTVPVLEAEIGGSWQPTENLMFSAGWLWQAWFDMGVSGGTTYGGNFAESDSASIMSFDGLFLRGMWRY
ncbi:MAG TPA: Lpg1974 family pore-forming outer membrane protein [Pirellulales bacterium]|nr:Lpg1974 family pore-forming outer membrane protein [Pirellulales bacterium]